VKVPESEELGLRSSRLAACGDEGSVRTSRSLAAETGANDVSVLSTLGGGEGSSVEIVAEDWLAVEARSSLEDIARRAQGSKLKRTSVAFARAGWLL
jgi:hypothetical protein